MPHFNETLTILRDHATDQFGIGRSFARLIHSTLSEEPDILGNRFERI